MSGRPVARRQATGAAQRPEAAAVCLASLRAQPVKPPPLGTGTAASAAE